MFNKKGKYKVIVDPENAFGEGAFASVHPTKYKKSGITVAAKCVKEKKGIIPYEKLMEEVECKYCEM